MIINITSPTLDSRLEPFWTFVVNLYNKGSFFEWTPTSCVLCVQCKNCVHCVHTRFTALSRDHPIEENERETGRSIKRSLFYVDCVLRQAKTVEEVAQAWLTRDVWWFPSITIETMNVMSEDELLMKEWGILMILKVISLTDDLAAGEWLLTVDRCWLLWDTIKGCPPLFSLSSPWMCDRITARKQFRIILTKWGWGEISYRPSSSLLPLSLPLSSRWFIFLSSPPPCNSRERERTSPSFNSRTVQTLPCVWVEAASTSKRRREEGGSIDFSISFILVLSQGSVWTVQNTSRFLVALSYLRRLEIFCRHQFFVTSSPTSLLPIFDDGKARERFL